MTTLNYQPKRLFILAIRAIGDVVLMTPIFRQLREALPDAHLTVLADGMSVEVLQNNPHLDRVLKIDRRRAKQSSKMSQLINWGRFIAEVRQEHFDAVVDLFSGPRTAMLAWLTGAPDRYGEDVRNRIRGFLYNHCIPISRDRRHLIEQKLQLIEPLAGKIQPQQAKLELFVAPDERQQALALLSSGTGSSTKYVGLVPGAGSRWRLWPCERFAELADVITRRYNAQIILIGGSQDRSLCQQIVDRTKNKPLDLSGKTSLRQLIAVLAELDLVVANVTGPMHIASALSKPYVIGLYGAADTIQYGPWSNRATMLTKGKPEEAYWRNVDYEKDYKRLLEISVADVVATIDRTAAISEYRGGQNFLNRP